MHHSHSAWSCYAQPAQGALWAPPAGWPPAMVGLQCPAPAPLLGAWPRGLGRQELGMEHTRKPHRM